MLRGATYRARKAGDRLTVAHHVGDAVDLVQLVVLLGVTVDHGGDVGFARRRAVVRHGDVALDPRRELVEGEPGGLEAGDERVELLLEGLVELGVEEPREEVVEQAVLVEHATGGIRRLEARHATGVILREVDGVHGAGLLELDEVDEVQEPVDEVVRVELLAEVVDEHAAGALVEGRMLLVEIGELVVEGRVGDGAQDDSHRRRVGLVEVLLLDGVGDRDRAVGRDVGARDGLVTARKVEHLGAHAPEGDLVRIVVVGGLTDRINPNILADLADELVEAGDRGGLQPVAEATVPRCDRGEDLAGIGLPPLFLDLVASLGSHGT